MHTRRSSIPWMLAFISVEVLALSRLGLPSVWPLKEQVAFDPRLLDLPSQRRGLYDPQRDLNVGEHAPVRLLYSLDGRKLALGRPTDRPIVVVFASDCSSCGGGATLAQWDALQHVHSRARVVVATQDQADRVREVLAVHHLRIRVLLDRRGEVARAYNALWYPRAYVLDSRGRVAYVQPDSIAEAAAIGEVSKLLGRSSSDQPRSGDARRADIIMRRTHELERDGTLLHLMWLAKYDLVSLGGAVRHGSAPAGGTG
jgi:peroxiredoxin